MTRGFRSRGSSRWALPGSTAVSWANRIIARRRSVCQSVHGIRVCQLRGDYTCRNYGARMSNAAGKRAYQKGLCFKLSRRSLCNRFGKRWSCWFRWEWYWQMRVMGRARNSALTSPNWDCNMQWALSRTPTSGNRGSNPCRRRHENQGGVRPQSGCNAMRTISLSR